MRGKWSGSAKSESGRRKRGRWREVVTVFSENTTPLKILMQAFLITLIIQDPQAISNKQQSFRLLSLSISPPFITFLCLLLQRFTPFFCHFPVEKSSPSSNDGSTLARNPFSSFLHLFLVFPSQLSLARTSSPPLTIIPFLSLTVISPSSELTNFLIFHFPPVSLPLTSVHLSMLLSSPLFSYVISSFAPPPIPLPLIPQRGFDAPTQGEDFRFMSRVVFSLH